ncbi:MAG TPA: VWA domain-containing protein [Candidatus Acidoferrales bacterium]|nr:VWA domain-containing protein [Candidatus Acidoferrales bacterium]
MGSAARPRGPTRQAPAAQGQIQATSDLVKIDVTVLDSAGNFVTGLSQKNFRVLDNGVERPLTLFMPTEAPAQVVLMIEASPSVYLIHDTHLLAAYSLLGALDPADEVAVIAYNRAPKIILPFTTNKQAAVAAIGGLEYGIGSGQLNFYDSVSQVLDWLAPRGGKICIVLITTGLDPAPAIRLSALAEKVRMRDDVIFCVALGGSLRTAAEKPARTKSKKQRHSSATDRTVSPSLPASSAAAAAFSTADGALKSLAKITGGRAYFPQSANDFAGIYRQIAAAVRHEYVLGIAPQHDGEFHPITVRVLPPTGGAAKPAPSYQVLARQGYLAPAH